jgi:hypothetical protein
MDFFAALEHATTILPGATRRRGGLYSVGKGGRRLLCGIGHPVLTMLKSLDPFRLILKTENLVT